MRLSTLACALPFVFATGLTAGTAGDAAAQAAGSPVAYDVPAGPLSVALSRFAQQAGVAIVVDADLLQGLRSPGLKGRYGVEEGFDALLRGSGYVASRNAAGYVLCAAPATTAPEVKATLPAVVVTARAEPSLQQEGTLAQGYRARTVSSAGALGSLPLQDAPFSISVLPQDLIKNVQAQSPDDLYKLNPSTRTTVPQATGWSPTVSIRGFDTYDTAEDGLRRPYNHAAVIEDKERVEVLNGLSGFLYGAAAPAGMINYVYKRPTQERLASVTVGDYGGGQFYVHGDFGGRIGEDGRAGYRLNLVRQDGDTAIDDQEIARTLVSGALDWNLTDRLLLEVNATYNHYKTQSPSAYWYYEVPHGAAPDAGKDWSQPWVRDEFENTKLMGRLTYQLNDQVTLRGAYTRSFVDRPVQDHTLNYVGTAGQYEQIAIHSGRTTSTFDAAQALVDWKFDTAGIAHALTAGYFMYSSKDWGTTYSPNSGWLGPFPLSSPIRLPQPDFPADTSSPYLADKVANQNIVIGDSITLDERWSALVGLTRSQITTKDYLPDGTKAQPDYDKSRNSPSVSLVFKPAAWLTTYATYIEGLEIGGRAPDETANAGSIMPPMVSRQRELGAKADVGGLLLTAAVFEIEKAYEYTSAANVYTQSGRQNHRGFELMATGRPMRRWTLLGGLTVLDTAIHGGDYDGEEPINVAKLVAKVYSEVDLPVPGLSLSGGVYYTGKQWADSASTDRLPAYTTVDLGLRFTTPLAGQPLTLRVNLNNATDKHYWTNTYYVGAPRSLAFSAQYAF